MLVQCSCVAGATPATARHCLGNVFAQMLQVGAEHACVVHLCGRRNTCNGDQFLCEFQNPELFISFWTIDCSSH